MTKLFDALDGDYGQLPWGRLEYHNNEIHIVTDRGDAAGLSFRGATNSKVSWKDAGGSEKVLLILRENAKGQGEFYFGCFSPQKYAEMVAKGGGWAEKALDLAMIELATLNPDGLEVRVPVKFSAGTVGGAVPAASGGVSNKIVSPDGRLELDIQNADAPGLVVYMDGKPVWSAELKK